MDNQHRFLRGIRLQLCAATIAGLTCTAASAQDETGEAPGSEPIDEITVVGEKSLTLLRGDMYRAEEDFLELFSSLNSDDDFDFKCDYVTPTQVRRRYHICMPRFARRAQADASTEMIMGWHLAVIQLEVPGLDSYSNFGGTQRSRVRRKEREMWDEMATMVRENAELRQSLGKLVNAKNAYDAERQRRSGSRDSAE